MNRKRKRIETEERDGSREKKKTEKRGRGEKEMGTGTKVTDLAIGIISPDIPLTIRYQEISSRTTPPTTIPVITAMCDNPTAISTTALSESCFTSRGWFEMAILSEASTPF